jgi:hypothetical protein
MHTNAHESGTVSSADLISEAQMLRLFVPFVSLVDLNPSRVVRGGYPRMTRIHTNQGRTCRLTSVARYRAFFVMPAELTTARILTKLSTACTSQSLW